MNKNILKTISFLLVLTFCVVEVGENGQELFQSSLSSMVGELDKQEFKVVTEMGKALKISDIETPVVGKVVSLYFPIDESVRVVGQEKKSETVLFTMLNGVLREFMPIVNASLVAAVLKDYPQKDAAFIERFYATIQKFSGLSPQEKLEKFNQSFPQDSVEDIAQIAAQATKLKKTLSEQVDLSPIGEELLKLFRSDLSFTISVDTPADIQIVMNSNQSLQQAKGLLLDTLGHSGESDYKKFSHVDEILREYPDIHHVFLVFDAEEEIRESHAIAKRLKKEGKDVHVVGIVYPMSSAGAKEALKKALEQIDYSGSVAMDELNYGDQSYESLSKFLQEAGADFVLSGFSKDLTEIEALLPRKISGKELAVEQQRTFRSAA